jgi:hypothetical protein
VVWRLVLLELNRTLGHVKLYVKLYVKLKVIEIYVDVSSELTFDNLTGPYFMGYPIRSMESLQ